MTILRRPFVVILAGCLVALLGFGVRSALGLFLEPMVVTRGWDHGTFALAMAVQNLLWGLTLPAASMLADRYGAARVLALGSLVYAGGIAGMALAPTPGALYLTGGVLAGVGIAATSFSIALAVMAAVAPPERRSLVLGIGTASGSAGQVVFSPLGNALIAGFGWQQALLMFAMAAVLIAPLAMLLPNVASGTAVHQAQQRLGEALREAFAHRGYLLLTTGFFVCGFHVAFITVHFPAYVSDLGLPAHVGAWSLALIGLFNICGSLLAGIAGQRYSLKRSLATIYSARAVAITFLLLAPKTSLTVYAFAASMGILWLSTVPLTSGIVAQVFGVRYMATLFAIVFVSHQLGSFSGIWLGGYLHDTRGSYDAVWWAGVGLSVAAALIHLPIDERPLRRASQTAPAPAHGPLPPS